MDSPGCRRQGPAGLGACRARLPSPSLCAVIQLPYLSCLHRPHPHPHPRGPHPNSNQNQRPCLLWACPPTPSSSRSPLSPSTQEVPASLVPGLSQRTGSRAQKLPFNTGLIMAFPPPGPGTLQSSGSCFSGWCDPWEKLRGWGGGGGRFHLLCAKAHQMRQEC